MMENKIKVDLERVIGTIDSRVYSGFIEHLGRCIYGGIYDEGSALSDEHGYRKDVMEAMRALKPPILRWPGGNFVSGYHWTDGIGPVEQRPRRMELAWHAEESNRFGTDEFLRYCELMHIEPYICVNAGSGTMDEAQAWVEYCNGTGNTYWANLRRQNGHPEPYHVTYWGLGNEMYGAWQVGALNAEDYAKKAAAFAKVMKLTDPSIKLVSCGESGVADWDRVVIEQLARFVDFHSIHIYTGDNDYYRNVFAPHQAERALRICQATIEQVRYQQQIEQPIYVAYDEWNVWFRTGQEQGDGLEERYTLSDALAVATYLNIFLRQCNSVRLANLAQMVNVIAPIYTSEQGMFLQTIYHPLRLYANYMYGDALDVHVSSETHNFPAAKNSPRWTHDVTDLGPFKLLDASAAYDAATKTLAVAVINRDQEQAHATSLQFADASIIQGINVYTVNASTVDAINSFEENNVSVQEQRLDVGGASFSYTFPAHSFTLLRMHVR
ncbi:MAG TPA: alpha-L-arabinofuranosidase C-terminal domain-containing protein [Ktedonobacteraceae bacterium]|jgi:alpha-N-arabinofuranosidase|nr:alpha-L-arabinofuranosidase C-terminal domain-containing protein [Ktedonobacteraceae bacterium]